MGILQIVSVRSVVAVVLTALGMSAPLVWAESPPQSAVEIAQARPPVELSSYPTGNDDRSATLGHIRWLAERSDLRWEENQRRWEENQRQMREIRDEVAGLRDEVAELKNTAIIVLGMIVAALLGVIAVQLPRREKRPIYSPEPNNPIPHHSKTASVGN